MLGTARNFALFFTLLLVAPLASQTEPEPYVTKRFVILLSTRDFNQAVEFARKTAARSGVKLDLRDLKADQEIGLSYPKQFCEDNGFGFPCYIARGRSDDGEYISVEHSSAFQGFRPGYYIVIGASYAQGKPEIKTSLKKFRTFAKDAYAKRSKVYVGCIH